MEKLVREIEAVGKAEHCSPASGETTPANPPSHLAADVFVTPAGIAAKQHDQPLTWRRQVGAVLFKHVYLKSIGTTVFITLFFNAYFYLLRNPAYPVTVMPFTWIDSQIGFQPMALPLYVSMWVYVSLPPALLGTRRELISYCVAIAATCLAGLAIFYFWPTAVPPADIDWSRFPELDFLKNIDAAGNACPSLHVTTAVFSGVWLHHLLRRFGGPAWLLIFNWAWCIGIVYSTLATRQHVVLDALGGLVLGLLAAWLSLQRRVAAKQH